MLKNKKSAFSLAEVLVTLIIIGVIAAMTVPGLKRNSDMEEYAVGCKKAYSTISNATRLIETNHGDVKRWGKVSENPESLQKIYDYYSEVMNVIKSCPANTTGCWEQSTALNGQNAGNEYGIEANSVSFATADGMFWTISGGDPATVGVDNAPEGSIIVWADINGKKKPNQIGSDVFSFVIDPTRGVLPGGSDNNFVNCTSTGEGKDCTARVIKEGKITY